MHHPYDDTLARFAAGRLSAGPRLVVATHLAGCPECRMRVGLFEAAGGALLDEAPAVSVRPDMFAATLRRLEEAAPIEFGSARSRSPLEEIAMPRWRSVGNGLSWRRLKLPDAPQANVIMLKSAPGRSMPQHTHEGTEYTQVLQGSFHDDYGRYCAGDCIEADDEVEHEPIVDSDVDCICLAAFDGKIRLKGWLARVVQGVIGL